VTHYTPFNRPSGLGRVIVCQAVGWGFAGWPNQRCKPWTWPLAPAWFCVNASYCPISQALAAQDIGFVGEVTGVHPDLLRTLVADGYIPVLATVAADSDGQALNVNADIAAGEVHDALCPDPLPELWTSKPHCCTVRHRMHFCKLLVQTLTTRSVDADGAARTVQRTQKAASKSARACTTDGPPCVGRWQRR